MALCTELPWRGIHHVDALSGQAGARAKQPLRGLPRLPLPGKLVVLPVDVEIARGLVRQPGPVGRRADARHRVLHVRLVLHLLKGAVIKLLLRVEPGLHGLLGVGHERVALPDQIGALVEAGKSARVAEALRSPRALHGAVGARIVIEIFAKSDFACGNQYVEAQVFQTGSYCRSPSWRCSQHRPCSAC